MSVDITPAGQLGFPRPLTRLITRSIKIHNPNPHPIAFKVKTTAPKQYCVRPNSGRVESGESVEVQVLLQPLTTEPPPHAKCKDKFLVQSAFITPDEEMRTLGEMWAQTEANNKGAIQEQKIKCVYLAPEDGKQENGITEEEEGMESRLVDDSAVFAAAQSSPAAKLNGTADRTLPGSTGSQPPIPATGQPFSSATPANVPQTNTSRQPETLGEKERLPDLTAETINASGSGTKGISPTNAALEQSLNATTSPEEKLKVALAEIQRLQSQLTEAQGPQVTGLRRRGGGSISAEVANAGSVQEGAQVMVEKAKEVVAGNQGVPLEVVVGLVLATFVMTYLFF